MTPIFYSTVHRVCKLTLNPDNYGLRIYHYVSIQLRTAVLDQLQGSSSEVDMLNWMGRLALELVGQGGLGYSFDPLLEDVHNPFGDAIKRIV